MLPYGLLAMWAVLCVVALVAQSLWNQSKQLVRRP